jgi:hypothetical protein
MWWALINTAMKIWVPQNAGNFLEVSASHEGFFSTEF